MGRAKSIVVLGAVVCVLAACASEPALLVGADAGPADARILADALPAGADARGAPADAPSSPDGPAAKPDAPAVKPDGPAAPPDAAAAPPDAPAAKPDAPAAKPDAPAAKPDAPPDAPPPPPPDAPQPGPLRVDPVNPRYFSDGTRVVYLTGSHTWGNFKDRAHVDPPPPFDYSGFLDFLVAHHHNFFRLWTWEQAYSFDDFPDNLFYFAQFPWPRTGPDLASDGKPRFDLGKFDQSYFDRLRAHVVAASQRGIYVSVMLFDGWDLANAYNPTNGGFPYGSGNNVNGVAVDGTDSQSLVDDTVTGIQEAYVAKVIATVNDLDNVLYEIANETLPGSVDWQYHMIAYVKQVEAGKPKQHPVGMTSTYPGTDSDLYASDADWISPNARLVDADGRKVVLNDTDHSYGYTSLQGDGLDAQRAWAWKTLALGASPLFMDPYLEAWPGRNDTDGTSPDPYWDTIRDALGRTRRYADRLDLERATPSGQLSSTGYCLADPGNEYLVYQPDSGSFTLEIAAGTYAYEWYDPAAGTVEATGTVTVGAETHMFVPPFAGDAVLLLER